MGEWEGEGGGAQAQNAAMRFVLYERGFFLSICVWGFPFFSQRAKGRGVGGGEGVFSRRGFLGADVSPPSGREMAAFSGLRKGKSL